jgi:hypothetical protein
MNYKYIVSRAKINFQIENLHIYKKKPNIISIKINVMLEKVVCKTCTVVIVDVILVGDFLKKNKCLDVDNNNFLFFTFSQIFFVLISMLELFCQARPHQKVYIHVPLQNHTKTLTKYNHVYHIGQEGQIKVVEHEPAKEDVSLSHKGDGTKIASQSQKQNVEKQLHGHKHKQIHHKAKEVKVAVEPAKKGGHLAHEAGVKKVPQGEKHNTEPSTKSDSSDHRGDAKKVYSGKYKKAEKFKLKLIKIRS